MIIKLLSTLLYNVFNVLLIFKLPTLPDGVMDYIDVAFGYLETGASILANYTPLGYLLTLFAVLLAVDAGILIYKFVIWVIKKIPMLGVS